jgi:hypothetical protein
MEQKDFIDSFLKKYSSRCTYMYLSNTIKSQCYYTSKEIIKKDLFIDTSKLTDSGYDNILAVVPFPESGHE